MKKILLSTTLVCLLSSVWGQCMLYPVSLDERIQQSAIIMEGTVVSCHSYWDASRGNIYTLHEFKASKRFRWYPLSEKVSTFYIVTEGGRVGDMKQNVTSSLELEVGDWGIFFGILAKAQFNQAEIATPLPMFEAYAGPQGFIKFDENGDNATDPFNHYIVNPVLYNRIIDITGQKPEIILEEEILPKPPVTVAAPVVSSFSPDSASAGTKTKLTINGSNFGNTRGTSYVGFKNGDDGGSSVIKPYDVEYISWSDTKIEVEVTAKAGTGKIEVNNGSGTTQSSASLVVTFAQLNVRDGNDIVYQPRHIGRNGNGYVWQMYTGFDANAVAKQSFLRAFQNWRCGTLINWDIGTTTTVNTIALDNTNVVRFDIGNELPSGVLGRCSSWWSGCSNGGTFDWYVNELDIVFDDGTNWHYTTGNPISSRYDFESVAVHELGHGHQLGHVIKSTEIMHYSISNGQVKRTLSTNGDLKGGNYVMAANLSGAFCGKTIMKALTTNSCSLIPVAGFMASDTTLCPSKVLTFTDTSSGSTNSYSWSFGIGAVPATATGKGPHLVNYSTSGKKAVQLIVGGVLGNDTNTRIDYVNVLPGKPNKPISIFGVDTGCIAAQPFTINKVADAITYTWGVNGSGIANNSVDTTSSITFSAPGNAGVWVKAGNSCGVSDSVVKPVVVIAKPIAAFAFSIRKDTIDLANGTTGATTHVWKFGNNQTASSQNLLLIPNQSGTYAITLVASNSCGSDSVTKLVNFIMPSVGEGINKIGAIIYPNPFTHETTLKIDGIENYNSLVLNLFDISGRMLKSTSINTTETKIGRSNLAAGVYIFTLKNDNETLATGRLVIQ